MDVPVFSISADPTCMYQTPQIREAVAKIRTAIAHRQGLSCIFGDIGFGKSSLLRYIGSAYDSNERYRVASVPPKWASMAPYGFLTNLCREFEILNQRSTSAQMDALETFLVDQHRAGNTVLVMIDEAQLLRLECMELIRALLNYETHTEKLCQVVLAGQLELRNRLLTKNYKAFKSRIVAPVVLEVFTPEETEAMIGMRHDHWMVPNRFSHEASQTVHRLSRGVPRDIVQICRYACMIAGERQLERIEPETVEEAFSKLSVFSERETAEAINVRHFRARNVEDGHTLAEQMIYGILCREASGSGIVQVGYDRLAALANVNWKTAKACLKGLENKLSIETVAREDSDTRTGKTYRVYPAAEILDRRRTAGMEWVEKDRGVRFVPPPLKVTSA